MFIILCRNISVYILFSGHNSLWSSTFQAILNTEYKRDLEYLKVVVSPCNNVLTTSGEPTQPHVQWVPGAISLEVRQPECEADQSPPSVTQVKEALPFYTFVAWFLGRQTTF